MLFTPSYAYTHIYIYGNIDISILNLKWLNQLDQWNSIISLNILKNMEREERRERLIVLHLVDIVTFLP